MCMATCEKLSIFYVKIKVLLSYQLLSSVNLQYTFHNRVVVAPWDKSLQNIKEISSLLVITAMKRDLVKQL